MKPIPLKKTDSDEIQYMSEPDDGNDEAENWVPDDLLNDCDYSNRDVYLEMPKPVVTVSRKPLRFYAKRARKILRLGTEVAITAAAQS